MLKSRHSLIPVVLAAIVLALAACQTTKSSYFETPRGQLAKQDVELFDSALKEQKEGRLEKAAELWEKFLETNPRSYEAHSNLGMTLYSNDKLSESIKEFARALELEPGDETIKANYARALKFQTTLYEENKDYEKALDNLKRVEELSPEDKEKIRFEKEGLYGKLYDQAKMADTAAAYQNFLNMYPEAPQVKEAESRLKALSQTAGVPNLPTLGALPPLKPAAEETMKMKAGTDMGGPPSTSILEEETPEAGGSAATGSMAAKRVKKMQEGDDGEHMAPESAGKMKGGSDSKQKPMAAAPTPQKSASTPAATTPAQKKLVPSPKKAVAKVARGRPLMVQIMTKSSPLRVRKTPDSKGKIVGHLSKNAVAPYLGKSDGWYRVEYEKGKTGWISKKFTKILK